MKISVGENLKDYTPPGLPKGKAFVTIERAIPTKDEVSIILNWLVTDAPDEKIIGETGSEFLKVNLSNLEKKGYEFFKRKLAKTCKAFGVELAENVESEDFVGKSAWVILSSWKGQDGAEKSQFGNDFPNG